MRRAAVHCRLVLRGESCTSAAAGASDGHAAVAARPPESGAGAAGATWRLFAASAQPSAAGASAAGTASPAWLLLSAAT